MELLKTDGLFEMFRMSTYDSVAIQTGVQQYSLFKDCDDEIGARYNKEHEINILRWIKDHYVDHEFFQLREELAVKATSRVFLEVRSPVIIDNLKPGDIDILIVNPSEPHLAIAIQVKRIKAYINTDDIAQIHDGPVNKGVEQSRLMFEKYRFHKNYLMLLIVADTMNRKHDSQMFRYLSWAEKLPLYRNPMLSSLPGEVGLLSYEINQSSQNAINSTGTLLVKEIKKALPVDQFCRTTESIREFLRIEKAV
jgi:hypothetical protein